MTLEKAIELKAAVGRLMYSNNKDVQDYNALIDFIESALRPVSQEQVEQVWGGCEWCDEEWGTCNPITNRFTMPPRGGIRFCPMCGRPLTGEAVEMVIERMEELSNGKG